MNQQNSSKWTGRSPSKSTNRSLKQDELLYIQSAPIPGELNEELKDVTEECIPVKTWDIKSTSIMDSQINGHEEGPFDGT